MASDKEEIRARSDIVEIIGTFVPLKKKGRNWVGLCPFHQEKTPSFNVDPVTQSFKCFGCSLGGDVFTFVERFENMTFVEAAEYLARRAGLTFDRKGAGAATPEQQSEREQLFAINRLALEWFRRMLDRVQIARDYVYRARGMAHETVQRFQVGYAPEGWDGLAGYLQAQRQDLKLAATAGLLHQSERTRDFYDVFRHRVLFPIHDEQERVVGFGGRAFGDEQPKYLNTGETPLFAKSRLLYGLPFARRKIAAEGRTLLMEGYMDVIAAHQAGFTNAVATLGTSLTEEHAKKLARLAPVVVLVYDADNAGIKATLRASEVLEKENVEVRTVRLPDGDDPDSMLKRGEIARLQEAIDKAVGRVEYLVEYAKGRHNLSEEPGRLSFLRDLNRILLDVADQALCDAQFVKYADLHPLAKHGIPSAIEQMRRELAERRAGRKRRPASDPKPDSDPTATRATLESRLRVITAMMPESLLAGRPDDLASDQKELWFQYRRLKSQLPDVQPVAQGSGGLTSEERAERELLRALVEPEWRTHVLKRVAEDDLLTPLGRRLLVFVRARPEAQDADKGELLRLLGVYEGEEYLMAMRELVQEFHALMANVPITDALLDECVAALRRHHKEQRLRLLQEQLAHYLHGERSAREMTADDRRLWQEYQALVRTLKGGTGP